MLSRLQQRISEMTCIDPIHSLIFCFLFLQHHAPTLQGLACLLLPTCNCHFPPKNKAVRLGNIFFFLCVCFFFVLVYMLLVCWNTAFQEILCSMRDSQNLQNKTFLQSTLCFKKNMFPIFLSRSKVDYSKTDRYFEKELILFLCCIDYSHVYHHQSYPGISLLGNGRTDWFRTARQLF